MTRMTRNANIYIVAVLVLQYIFAAIEEKFENHEIPWKNCVSLSVDNTNAMIGKYNSVASQFLQKNENIFISGCPCHLAHIAASKGNDAFSEYINLNAEDLMVDLYQGKLKEYFQFCDQEYRAV